MRVRSNLLRQAFTAIVLFATFARGGLAQDCRVETIVRVIDKHGQPVTNITAAEIRAEINGNLENISSLSLTMPEIILILDVSPSMKHAWNQSLAAAKQLAEKTENVDTFIFRERVQGYAIGRSKSEELLDQLSKQGPPSGLGGTALYDTLIEIAGRVTAHNAAIVVISDGGDNMSQHSSDATASLFLHSSWPPVFALILDYDETGRLRGYFKKIPAATGGMTIYPPSASKVSNAAEELAAVVLSPFVLTLQVQRSITDMSKLKLEAVGPGGKQRKDINVLHVAEIPACKSR
ncbi:MAG TPA: VWA domain-containing protein [Terriglobales bacterium]|jgi:hypothetical protein|nr:VWA domain-containing protein [Terriglobales bacterium]